MGAGGKCSFFGGKCSGIEKTSSSNVKEKSRPELETINK